MKRQFLQMGEVRADASEMEAFSFLLLHLGIYSTCGRKSADARKSTRASQILHIF